MHAGHTQPLLFYFTVTPGVTALIQILLARIRSQGCNVLILFMCIIQMKTSQPVPAVYSFCVILFWLCGRREAVLHDTVYVVYGAFVNPFPKAIWCVSQLHHPSANSVE